MMEFANLAVITDYLVMYFAGNELILGLSLSFLFLLIFVARGVPLKYSFAIILPVLLTFNLVGVFGTNVWVVNIVLLIVSILYGIAMLKVIG
jgi:hypothetical protein